MKTRRRRTVRSGVSGKYRPEVSASGEEKESAPENRNEGMACDAAPEDPHRNDAAMNLLIHRVFEGFAGGEFDRLRRSDFDFFAGTRVASGTFGA
ncbi:MAG: hypothetical protein V7642_3533 [Burkholderiales bacterium]